MCFFLAFILKIWDLSTALELSAKGTSVDGGELGGPTAEELIHLVDQCDLSNSRNTTPSASPSPALMAGTYGTAALSVVSAQCTPQAARRRFLEERSHVGPLGTSSVVGESGSGGRAAVQTQASWSAAACMGSTESLGGPSVASPPVKFHS